MLLLTPHMTVVRLTLGLASLAYLMAGSRHEEQRLVAAYGEAYEAYRRSGVPFFWPSIERR